MHHQSSLRALLWQNKAVSAGSKASTLASEKKRQGHRAAYSMEFPGSLTAQLYAVLNGPLKLVTFAQSPHHSPLLSSAVIHRGSPRRGRRPLAPMDDGRSKADGPAALRCLPSAPNPPCFLRLDSGGAFRDLHSRSCGPLRVICGIAVHGERVLLLQWLAGFSGGE